MHVCDDMYSHKYIIPYLFLKTHFQLLQTLCHSKNHNWIYKIYIIPIATSLHTYTKKMTFFIWWFVFWHVWQDYWPNQISKNFLWMSNLAFFFFFFFLFFLTMLFAFSISFTSSFNDYFLSSLSLSLSLSLCPPPLLSNILFILLPLFSLSSTRVFIT